MDPSTATEVKELYAILRAVLQNDNKLRLEAEERLKTYLAAPAKLLQHLVTLMQEAQEDFIRKLSSVLFKHYVALKEVRTVWKELPSAQQESIKNELLSALKKEQDPRVSRQICQSVAELAGLLFGQGKDWAQLDELVVACISGTDFMVETAFQILTILFAMNSERYMKNAVAVCGLFDTAFQKTSSKVLCITSKAICTLVAEIDTTETKPFLKYSAPVITTLQLLLNEGNEDLIHELLEMIAEVVENEPAFFRRSYPQLSDVLIKIASKTDFDNDKLRQMPLEILITVLERLPRLAQKYQPQFWNLGSAIFSIMVSIDKEVDESWLRPKEGHNMQEDMNAEENVNFGMISFDRLLNALGDEQIFPLLEKVMETAMSSEDWRYRHAGLLAVAEIGEYCEGVEKVQNVVPLLVQHTSHAHPKVRYAAVYSLGMLADYMYPKFQDTFGEKVLPPLVAAIDDPVPRVQSYACAALTNFLEHVSQTVALQVAPVLLPKLIKCIREGISIVKENATTCVSSIAESADEQFLPYYKELMLFMFECVRQFATKEYHQVRGQTIECMSIMSISVEKTAFAEFAPTFIETLIALQNSELNKDDPQRFYLMGAWQRVCRILKKDFAQYLPRVIPGIMKIAGSAPKMAVGSSLRTGSLDAVLREVSGDKGDDAEVSTYEIEEKNAALEMLQVFASHLAEKYAPYVEETTMIVEPLLTFKANSDIRKSAAVILPILMRCLKAAQIPQPALVSAGSKYIADLLQAHDAEIHADIKSAQVLSLKDVFAIVGHFMTPEDTKAAITKTLGFFKISTDRKNALISENEACKDEEDGTPEPGQDEVTEDSVEAEEIYQRDLTFLLGAIIDEHKDESLPEVGNIISNVVQPYLAGDVEMQRVAVFLVVDIIAYLGMEKLGLVMWKQLVAIILTYATRPEHTLRQAACYGIGCVAKTGGAAFAEYSAQCLTILATAIEVKEDKKRHADWLSARDNAISAIGRILKYQSATVSSGDIWAKWLHYLPLRNDAYEARFSHEFVVDTVIANPEVAVGANGSLLEELIRIFVAVYEKEKKLINVQTISRKHPCKEKMHKAMKLLCGYPAVMQMIENIYNTKLKSSDKPVFEKLMNPFLCFLHSDSSCIVFANAQGQQVPTFIIPLYCFKLTAD